MTLKKQSSIRIVGICAVASRLGCSHTHLRRIISGERPMTRKTYTLGKYTKPGFTCEGVGPDVWSDAYKMSLQSFGNRKAAYVLIVTEEDGRRAKPLMKFGAFCRIKDVIAAIEEEEGGAK